MGGLGDAIVEREGRRLTFVLTLAIIALGAIFVAGIISYEQWGRCERELVDRHREIDGYHQLIKQQDAELSQLGVANRKMEMDYRDLAGNHRRSLQVLEQQKKLLALAMKAIRNANVEDKELVDQALKAIKEYGTSDSDLIGQPTYEEYVVPAKQ